MGSNLPFGRRAGLEWLEAHIEHWQEDPAAIGLTAAQVDALATRIEDARDGYTRLEAARIDAKARTKRWYAQADELHAQGADLILAIKAFADNSPGGPTSSSGIYQAAGLTRRRAAAPLPAPDRPGNLRATLTTTGHVLLKWDGRGPTGTVYIVRRRLQGESNFSIIGQSGGRAKSLTDTSVPAGTTIATYSVQAVRGEQRSENSGALAMLFGNLGEAGLSIAA